MVADFRHFYAIDLPCVITDEIDEELKDVQRYSMLFMALPREARSIQRISPEAQWSTTDYLLWLLEFDVRSLQRLLLDKKASSGQKAPKPLPTPAETAHNIERKENALKNKEEIDRRLGMKGA